MAIDLHFSMALDRAAGHNRDVPPKLRGELGSERRGGKAARLDDHDHIGKRSNDPPRSGKAPTLALEEPRREL